VTKFSREISRVNALMMEAGKVSEMMDFCSELTWLMG
jgi:hypothetical protein